MNTTTLWGVPHAMMSFDLTSQSAGEPVAAIKLNIRDGSTIDDARGQIGDWLQKQMLSRGIDLSILERPFAFAIGVKMPCGSTVLFKAVSDIPGQTTHCPCGNKDHYIVIVQHMAEVRRQPLEVWP